MSCVVFNRVVRKPLRTLAELCKELGIEPPRMRGLLARADAPKKVMRAISMSASNTYFEPIEFRRWFATLNRTTS